MLILGVNPGPHDGSAALVEDGELVVLVEQERLSRRKHAFGESPAQAVRACLDSAGLMLSDIDEVAVGWDVPKLASIEQQCFSMEKFRRWIFPEELFPESATAAMRFVPHHQAHAASAFWTSGVAEAAIIVMDGTGEAEATSLALGGPGGIKIMRQWDVRRSLGWFYEFAAEWAGLSLFDAGKLMGLAAYGSADQPTPIVCTSDGYDLACGSEPPAGYESSYFRASFKYLRETLREFFQANNYPYQQGSRLEPMAHAAFAASVQQALEIVASKLVELLRDMTDVDHLVLAGGVALNCTMNGMISRSGVFQDVYVPPVPHDAGVSLGAALTGFRRRGTRIVPNRLQHAYWGPEHSKAEVASALRAAHLDGVRLSPHEMAAKVAEELARGRIIGWWQGRSEVGQRALGARSILCDPRDRRNLIRVNRLKGREVWRPLAPSVLDDSVGQLFGHALPATADFMLSAWPVQTEARRLIPAAVHVDGSARPQIVRRSTNPGFWAVIDAFRQATGVPAIINTSFNLAGEPNVLSPDDAISTFLRGRLDVLAIDDMLVYNTASRAFKEPDPVPAEEPERDLFPWEKSSVEALA